MPGFLFLARLVKNQPLWLKTLLFRLVAALAFTAFTFAAFTFLLGFAFAALTFAAFTFLRGLAFAAFTFAAFAFSQLHVATGKVLHSKWVGISIRYR